MGTIEHDFRIGLDSSIDVSSSTVDIPYGLSSITVAQNTVIGGVTMPNKMRGIAIREFGSDVEIGIISSYDGANCYEITSPAESLIWEHCRDLHDMDRYVDIEFIPPSNIAAGTIGTRGWQGTYNLGFVPKSIAIIYISNSNEVHPLAFWYQNQVYCNLYRAVGSAITPSSAKTTVRVYY